MTAPAEDSKGTPRDWAALFADECGKLAAEGLSGEAARERLAPVLAAATEYGVPWTEAVEEGRKFFAKLNFPPDWLKPGEGLAQRTVPMARVSLAAVMPTLHENTRGGLPTGSVIALLGPPDSAKTGTAQTIADAAERQGWVVIHLAKDNGREPAEIRYGQLMGFDRTRLEEGEEKELFRFREAFAERRIWMPDPDLCNEKLEPINTLASIIEQAKVLFPGERVLLLPDSIQTVLPDAESYESPRLRVIATMLLLRKAVNIPGWLALAPCQINREAFKYKKQSANSDPLAAGAESASIEFGSDLMLFLSCSEDGSIWAQITKNKPGAGRKARFPIVWDREKARASEPDPGSFADEAHRIAQQAREQLRDKLEAIVAAEPGLSTKRVQEKARGHRESEITNTLDELAAAGRLACRPRGNGRYWYPPEASAGGIA